MSDYNSQDTFGREVARPERGSGFRCCVVVLILTLVIGLLTCAGGALVTWMYGKDWFAGAFRLAFVQVIEETELPENQKAEIIRHYDRVNDKFKKGDITFQELKPVFESVLDSPAMMAIMIEGFKAKYIAPSGLGEAEKDDARTVMNRFCRGVVDGAITQEEAEEAFSLVLVRDKEENIKELKKQLTKRELRLTVEMCRKLVESKGIPEVVEPVDVGAEFGKVVDQALKKVGH